MSRPASQAIEARAAIGADGVTSVVSSAIGDHGRGENDAGACCEYHIVCERPHDEDFVSYPWQRGLGYGWVFCADDGYYVGVGCLGPARRRARRHLDDLVDYCVGEGILPREHRVERTFGALAPATVVDTIAGDRVLLVGDAAGFPNQLDGEGIYHAMRSGQLAGRVLAERIDGSAGRYQDAVRPLIRESTYSRTIRPKLLHRVLSGCFRPVAVTQGAVPLPGR